MGLVKDSRQRRLRERFCWRGIQKLSAGNIDGAATMMNAWAARYGWLVLVPVVLLLSACQTRVREAADGPWIEIPPGSRLTLNRSISVPQDRARVFFRGGRVQNVGANVGPSCGIEVRTIPRDGPYTIAPGSFTITRVQDYWTQVAQHPAAGIVRLQLASSTDGGGNPLIQQGYHLWLSGPSDSNVMRLTCLGMLDDMWRARAPTLAEVRAALGALATLELSDPPRP
jgi:hypothetical protein